MSSCAGTSGNGVNHNYAGGIQDSSVNSDIEVDARANTKGEATLCVKKDGYAKGVKQGKYRQRLDNPTTDVKDTELKVLIDPFALTGNSNTRSPEHKTKLSRLLGNNFFSKQTRGHWDAIAARFNLDQRLLKTNPAFSGDSQYGDAENWAEVDASSMWNVELWGGSGINASEICQNDLGDCYFLSALASIALSDPGAIENMISYDPETDLYTVTFQGLAYDENDSVVPSGETVDIVIDDELLQKIVYDDNGEVLGYGDVGASMTDADGDGAWEIGVALIEKAFALYVDQMNALAQEQGQPPFFGDIDPTNASGYDLLNEGGFMETAFMALSGEQHILGAISMIGEDWGGDLSQEEWLMDLISSADEGVNVCVGSMVDCDLEGLVGGHAYTVLGLVEVEGEMMVALRNPWGVGEPGGNGDNDGIFLLTMDEFQSNFDQIAFNSETYFSSDWSSNESMSLSDAVNAYADWSDGGEVLDVGAYGDDANAELEDAGQYFIDFINNPTPQTGEDFATRLESVMQQFPHGNIMDILFLVFKESIESTNEDKKYFLKKLMMYNNMAEGLSNYLSDVLLPASDALGQKIAGAKSDKAGNQKVWVELQEYDLSSTDADGNLVSKHIEAQEGSSTTTTEKKYGWFGIDCLAKDEKNTVTVSADKVENGKVYREMNQFSLSNRIKALESNQETVRNKRQMASTAFQNFDQKTNQLYNLLSSVLKALGEMRMGTTRNML